MSRKNGTYYVGRVLKLGELDQEKLIHAIKEPVSIEFKESSWTFIDVNEMYVEGVHFVFGRLCKYKPLGEVSIVDTLERTEKTQIEPNLRIASSPFLYIPEHSGIVFLHIANQIEQKTFVKRFCSIIEETYDRFFVDCDIEMIADLRSFSAKLTSLDGIYSISAKISPPNPLFGPLWEDLKDYLIERNTDRMTINEESPESRPLITNLPEHVRNVADQTEIEVYNPINPLPIGDAAILMAADGYGAGTIRGKSDNQDVVIRTSETVKNFQFSKEPDPIDLFRKAKSILDEIKEKRHLEH